MNEKMWRLIDSGPGTGAWNMAVDEAILEACIRGESPPTLRIYTWDPPAISLGHFQSLEKALFVEACQARGLEVCRRPTGGRAILHDKEITFSIVASLTDLGTQGVMDSYRYLAQGIIAGLRRLGVAAELVERGMRNVEENRGRLSKAAPTDSTVQEVLGAGFVKPAIDGEGNWRGSRMARSAAPTAMAAEGLATPPPTAAAGHGSTTLTTSGGPALQHLRDDSVTAKVSTPAACFAVKARCDLMVGGRKIVGSAQVHRSGAVLQQNSLPFVIEAEKWKEVFRGMEGVGAEAVGLWEAAGRRLEVEEAARALREGFAEALGVDFANGELTQAEQTRAMELLPGCRVLAHSNH